MQHGTIYTVELEDGSRLQVLHADEGGGVALSLASGQYGILAGLRSDQVLYLREAFKEIVSLEGIA